MNPFNFSQIAVVLQKLENGTYRQIFKVSKIEWCSFMAGTSRSNYMITMLVNTIKSSATENIFHKCPFDGKIVLTNVTMKNQKLLMIYPSGNYRFVIKVNDDWDDEIFLINIAYKLET